MEIGVIQASFPRMSVLVGGSRDGWDFNILKVDIYSNTIFCSNLKISCCIYLHHLVAPQKMLWKYWGYDDVPKQMSQGDPGGPKCRQPISLLFHTAFIHFDNSSTAGTTPPETDFFRKEVGQFKLKKIPNIFWGYDDMPKQMSQGDPGRPKCRQPISLLFHTTCIHFDNSSTAAATVSSSSSFSSSSSSSSSSFSSDQKPNVLHALSSFISFC
ncbi:uncharacterized protein LOC114578352 isoform X2 [Dendrobium catenatum]|nr:uncharacterized protein LOC114578352 isoform X2 [Dendrobium catenatum]XP_028557059.1 uncharacterized protein LOC114578352 isoform X2 [Dendrobium catenatum]XP_028557060.1 uncharacterized protein LOC114578352 isoform X2 [Dendrobium catenatum]XP_028557061.1 uncharacterized protein LOC114578352 isoform X2 [Dendrobium catenatum]